MTRGAGGGRPTKPNSMNRNRHPPTKGTITVSASARVTEIPEPSIPFSGIRRQVWDAMWSQPIATLWSNVDLAPLTRLVILQTTAESLGNYRLLAEMRQLEDRFLLNPFARSQQRVVIDGGEPEHEGDVTWFNDAKRRLRGPSTPPPKPA